MVKFYKRKTAIARVSWVLIYALFFNAALPFSVFAASPTQIGASAVKNIDTGYVDDNSWIEQYVSQSSGNNSFTEERLSVPCPGIALELNLTYESISSHPDTGIGSHWTHSYEWTLVNDDSGKALHTGNGSKYIFEAVAGGYDSPNGLNWTLEAVPNGYALQLPGRKTYLFDSMGRLDAIEDAWGNSVQCNYDTNNCLITVQHDNGRQLTFTNNWDATLQEWRVGSVTVQDGASLAFSYDSDGQFTQIVERVGNNSYTSAYEYAEGLLTNRVDAAGFSYAYDYQVGSDGKCTSLSVDGNLAHEMSYIGSDVTDITSTMRGLEQRFRYSRNSEGILEAKYGPAMPSQNLQDRGVRYGYSTNHLDMQEMTVFDDQAGETWSQWMRYDNAHNMTNYAVSYCSTNPVQQMAIEYDVQWQLPSAIETADGARTETVYTNGLPAVKKAFYSDSESYDSHYTYSTNGLLRFVANANGNDTEFRHDEMGNMIAILPELGPSITNSYTARGDLERLEILAENGAATGRFYEFDTDAHGRLTELVFPDGLTSTYEYNALGMMTHAVDRAGRATETTYGPTGQKTSVTQYLNQNGSNIPVRISYNVDEQLNTLSITEPHGRAAESYQLDLQDRITAVTNIEGQVMTLDYSVGNFVSDLYRFDGSRIRMNYDEAGRISSQDYCAGEGDRWVFDDRTDTTNLVLEAALVTISNTYYPDGLLKTISDSASSVSNSYDRLNRLTNIVTTIGNLQSSVANAFDPVGNVTNSAVSIGGAQASATAYVYDEAERLSSISTALTPSTNSTMFSYAYSPENGRVSSVTNLESGLITSYAYDLMDRAINISYRTSTGSLIRSLDYDYDDVGMIREKTDFNASTTSTVSTAYTYDSLDRLVSETRTAGVSPASSTHYSYDLAGNRTSKVSNGWKTEYTLGIGNRLASSQSTAITNSLFVSGSANEPIGMDDRWGELWITNLTSGAGTTPSVNGASFAAEVPSIGNATNILVAAIRDRAGNVGYATNSIFVEPAAGGAQASATYQYDASGCLVSNVTASTAATNLTTYSWDERYRLTDVQRSTPHIPQSTISYAYDVLGRKVSRTAGVSPAEVEQYVYNDNQIVADLDGSNNVLHTYTWGPGIDNLLSMTLYPAITNSTDLTISTPLTLYPIKDHQNTVLAFVDENGSVVESYEYDAWENVTVLDAAGTEIDASNIGNRYTFQGREIDWSTGLIYFRARWYDPETGRWLSKDPIGISGGLNQYVFCGNNPVNNNDPWGLMSKPPDVSPGPGGNDVAEYGKAAIVVGSIAIPVAKLQNLEKQYLDELIKINPDLEKLAEIEKKMAELRELIRKITEANEEVLDT